MKTFSCVIPAYNEEQGIAKTLTVVTSLLSEGYLCEIVVVNDCSKDSTRSIIKQFPSITLIDNVHNLGKSMSVAEGVRVAKGDYIMLLDADLKGLDQKNILDLISPVKQGVADISMAYIKNAWPLFPFKDIDYLSGQRVLSKEIIRPHLTEIDKLTSYGLEVFLNRIIINNHLSISVVQWPNVENVFNQHKHGWVEGIKIVIKIWMNVISTISFFEMYSQNLKMKKLLISKI